MAGPLLVPLSAKLSELALKRYIETFMDKERMSFQTYLTLEKLRKNKGYRSGGYSLWDYFASTRKQRPYIISEGTFKSYKHKVNDILIYWDSTYVEGSSPFASTNMICTARYSEIAGSLKDCPGTLYLFDRSFEWTLVRTDEELNDLGWTCLQIGEIGSCHGQKALPDLSEIIEPQGNLVPLFQRRSRNKVSAPSDALPTTGGLVPL